MFLRETVIRQKGKEYRYWRIIKTYWDKRQRKVRHKTIAQLGKLKPEEFSFLKIALAGKPGERFSWDSLSVNHSLDYLEVAILDRLWQYWGLDKIFEKDIAKVVEILTINRCLEPNSDYQVSQWYRQTILPRILNIELNPTRIYRSLDGIHLKEKDIQGHLYKKIHELGVDDYQLIFYDITSSYFESSGCSLAQFGFSRDHRRDKKQLILALAVTKHGYPFYWKVLEGNTCDSKTVKGLVEELKERFKVEQTCLVLDKGMINIGNLEKIDKEKLYYIVTLRRHQIMEIENIPLKYLDTITENNYLEKLGYFIYHSKRAYYRELKPSDGKRYILCFNPEKFIQERKDRNDKIESIKRYLESKNKSLGLAKYRRDRKLLQEELIRYLKKRQAYKIFKFRLNKIKDGMTFHITYRLNEEALKETGILDGMYVISTNLGKKVKASDLIQAYRGRMKIERGFRYLKSFVEIRPIYHHNEERIRAHFTVCILGYLLSTTLERLIRNKEGFEDLTADTIIGYFKNSKAVELQIGKERRLKLTIPTHEQIEFCKILSTEELLNEDTLQDYI